MAIRGRGMDGAAYKREDGIVIIDPEKKIYAMSVSEKQTVEIAAVVIS